MASIITDLNDYEPSSFGKEFPKLIGKKQLKDLAFHRDSDQVFSFPSALACPLIGEYYDEIECVNLEEEDYLATRELCTLMMGGFRKDDDRREISEDFFVRYFNAGSFHNSTFSSNSWTDITTDGTVIFTFPGSSSQIMILNREVKRELGATGCSAPEECLRYHYQYLATRTKEYLLQRCCCPAILCSMVGPYLSLSRWFSLGWRSIRL
jgi:hypothetical protein